MRPEHTGDADSATDGYPTLSGRTVRRCVRDWLPLSVRKYVQRVHCAHRNLHDDLQRLCLRTAGDTDTTTDGHPGMSERAV